MSHTIVREAALEEREQILRIALTESRTQADQSQRISQMAQSYLQRCGGSVGAVHLVESAGQILTACAGLDLPGGVSLLIVPSWSLAQSSPEVLADLLAQAAQAVRRRGHRFAQVLLEPELAKRVRPQLLGAGFSFLANLLYMHRNAFDPAVVRPVEAVTWRTLREVGEGTVSQVIQRTYIGSRDCPGLTGIRSMPEVLAGHRGAGEFDPEGWYLLQYEGRNVGVTLTSRTPLRSTLELVYCGLVPEARGKGLGRICVHKAIVRARDLAVPAISLAVDAANEPARRMYEAMGFAAHTSRDVWIEVFRRADAEGAFEWPQE
jgi:mycothiol synthase